MAKATETPEFRRWLRWLVADVCRRLERNSPPTESDETKNPNDGKVQP